LKVNDVDLLQQVRERRIRVSEIAKKYRGGGHRKAAGFNLPVGINIETIFDAG
jgi:nanoRNase/pAp phosphatase (c-di-AMP/oligoRNAs hydrolase)